MRAYRLCVLAATLLAFFVVGLGAYVRLNDAGLGCPDWPGCYGHLVGVPDQHHEQQAAQQAFPHSPVETGKAWKEMIHRYFAGTLGLLIAAICVLSWRHRRELPYSPVLPTLLVGVVGFQAALGMWTVTLLLKPAIVTAHLLGGMTTLALLVVLSSRLHRRASPPLGTGSAMRLFGLLALLTVLVQIALGGWVSSNYAALACVDFPTCNGALHPDGMAFEHAFHLFRELGQTASGTELPPAALLAIHWTHRVGALLVFLVVGALALRLIRRREWKHWGAALGLLLLVQVSLGISNVLLSLPLPLAVAHNLGAALLLSALVAFNLRLYSLARRRSIFS
ncbi:MAG TPA: COX15/CtaA family protein [Rhodocyclaceae bacterium]|nr:COX15/CtaA family protein [Rhodocyclaceae bacterium]